jgi:hypothetical protein
VRVQLADLRQVRSLAGSGTVEVSVDAARWAAPSQDQWLETEIEVEKGAPLKLRAAGMINLNPQNGNQFMSGPDGSQQFGRNGPYAPGALIGRIGRHGQDFQIGSRYEGEASASGRLYLRVAPSPWGQMAAGSYTVTASTELGLGALAEAADRPAPARAVPPGKARLVKEGVKTPPPPVKDKAAGK